MWREVGGGRTSGGRVKEEGCGERWRTITVLWRHVVCPLLICWDAHAGVLSLVLSTDAQIYKFSLCWTYQHLFYLWPSDSVPVFPGTADRET